MNLKNQIRGKKARASGLRFEAKVRKDLIKKGWIVDKWSNNVELHKENSEEVSGKFGGPFGKLIPAKHKWRGPGIPMVIGTGFPDFICFRTDYQRSCWNEKMVEKYNKYVYEVIGCEVKSNGYLTKEEKEKCRWLLSNNIFSKILIAKKKKVGRKTEVEYNEFKE
ncbi:MAG: hypothetical protein ACTSXD_11795 [Candidatus Heimdallarchaeaceae archaeon]